MSSDLRNQIKRIALDIMRQHGVGRWGLVTNSRKTDTGYEVRCTMQPEGVMTGWLPVLSPMVGNGWGIVSPPALNSQAFVVPQEGYADHGVVVGMTFSAVNAAPQPGGTPVGEGQFALVHKNGSYFLFDDNDVTLVTTRDLHATVQRNATVLAQGSIAASAPNISMDADGKGGATQVNVTGDVHVSGDVFDSHGAMSALRGHYDAHTHTDSHGDTTGKPTPQD